MASGPPGEARQETVAAALRQGCRQLGIAISDDQSRALINYLAMLQRWNRALNLTAIRDLDEMVTLHLLDCLSVLPPLQRRAASTTRVLDVGSGGGLPGVVLAVMLPTVEVRCVDAVGKKAAFIQQVAGALQLSNLSAQHARIETLTHAVAFDLIVSRAFATLRDFVVATRALLAPQGVWMAMKGHDPLAERADLPPGVSVFHVEPLTVPGLAANRCLVWMRDDAGAATR